MKKKLLAQQQWGGDVYGQKRRQTKAGITQMDYGLFSSKWLRVKKVD